MPPIEERVETPSDNSAALAEISQGLGFNADSNEDTGDEHAGEESSTVEEGTAAPVPAVKPSGDADPMAPDAVAAAAAQQIVPPKTWRPEAAAAFAALPPVVQAEVLKREEDMFRGLEQYRGAATFGQTVHKTLQPYLPILQQYRIDPVQQISGLMQSHHTLALGTPDQKVGLMLRLVKDYGVDLNMLMQHADPNNAPYVDPTVQNLTQTVQTLQSELARQNAQRLETTRATLSSQIDAFAKDSKNVYFSEVANDMAALIEGGVCKTLEEAYEKAVWTNPSTRQREATRIAAEKAEEERKAAAAKAASARKATSANVRSTAKSGSATAPVGSIDDTLRETMEAIKARG